jgi:hypothetical protein
MDKKVKQNSGVIMNDRTKVPYKNIAAFFSVPFAIMFILFVVFL